MKLTIIAQFEARPGRADDLRAALEALIAPTRAEDGCEVYELHGDGEGFFHFHEIWTTREHWLAHMQTPHLKDFGARKDELVGASTLRELRLLA